MRDGVAVDRADGRPDRRVPRADRIRGCEVRLVKHVVDPVHLLAPISVTGCHACNPRHIIMHSIWQHRASLFDGLTGSKKGALGSFIAHEASRTWYCGVRLVRQGDVPTESTRPHYVSLL